jgi:hypothetical protein
MSDSPRAERTPSPRPWRRWLLRLAAALTVGVVAAIVTWALMPKPGHTVRTLVQIPPPSNFINRPGEPPVDLAAHQRIQLSLVKSQVVLASALRDPQVTQLAVLQEHPEPLAWLEKQVRADFAYAPEILGILMTGSESHELVVLVNAIRRAYMREAVDWHNTPRRQRQQYLAEQITRYEGQLKVARDTQKELEEQTGGKNPNVRGRVFAFVQEQLEMTGKELLTTQAALRKAELDLKLLKGRQEKFDESNVVDPGELEAALAKDPAVQSKLEEIKRKETLMAQYREKSIKGDKSPTVIRCRREIAELKGSIAAIREELRPRLMKQLQERARIDVQTQITILEMRIANLNETEAILKPEIDRLRTRLMDLGKQGVKLDRFTEDVTHLVNMANRLRGEAEALKVELNAPSQVRVIEEATITPVKEPWQPLVPALVGLGCFLAAFSCLALRVCVSLR